MAKSPQAVEKPDASGTVTRVVRLLQSLAETGDMSLKDLAADVELPPSTVHRLLQLLVQHDMVEQDTEARRYRPGLEFLRIGSLVASKSDIADLAEPLLRSIVETCNEVAFLVRYLPASHKVMIVRSVNSTHPLRYNIGLFEPDTMLWGATGRSVLAFLPDAEVQQALADAAVSPVTGEKLPARTKFLAELALIREAGYVCTRGQKMPGAVGIGAPVFGGDGHVLGSICITVPQSRFDPRQEGRYANLVKTHAARLSASLGHRAKANPSPLSKRSISLRKAEEVR